MRWWKFHIFYPMLANPYLRQSSILLAASDNADYWQRWSAPPCIIYYKTVYCIHCYTVYCVLFDTSGLADFQLYLQFGKCCSKMRIQLRCSIRTFLKMLFFMKDCTELKLIPRTDLCLINQQSLPQKILVSAIYIKKHTKKYWQIQRLPNLFLHGWRVRRLLVSRQMSLGHAGRSRKSWHSIKSVLSAVLTNSRIWT